MAKHIEDTWETEMDLDALQRAKEVKADPNRLAKAKTIAQEKIVAAKEAAASVRSPRNPPGQGFRRIKMPKD